jgi:hypothetical protein
MAGPATLKHAFEKEGDPEHVGGTGYPAELASSVITIINTGMKHARSMTCICAAS